MINYQGLKETVWGYAIMTESFGDYAREIVTLIGDFANGPVALLYMLSMVIGFTIFCAGLSRLYKHSRQQQMFRYHSPMATTLYFIASALLMSLPDYASVLSNTLVLTNLPYNPLATYLSEPDKFADTGYAMKVLIQACLIIIGVISLMRGTVAFIRLGEGQAGGGSDVGISIAHVAAGVIALNTDTILTTLGVWSS
ncbi:hypothetical protein L3V79_02635 [Thiotrichales bacterium 19S9-12]|nr:hypothetical protein [Thiotrichales bacterium 19S9-11]MCF6811255.1 hypothetical protein [Thiotrichales bacterium 19S9-12]